MSHHYSGPDFGFPLGDARLDLCDLFAFPKPGDTSRSVLIMDAHPSVSVNPPGPTTPEPFAPEAIYELKIDTDGDHVADIAYRVRFSSVDGNNQTATVRRVTGPDAAGMDGDGDLVVEDAAVSLGSEPTIVESNGCRFFAGWRSDPFFFDAGGALNNMAFTGDDFFADKDICCIALDVPNDALGSTSGVNLWHRTLVRNGAGSGWIQADRGARTQQAVFLPGEQRDEYLAGEPADDGRFVDGFAHALEHAGGYSPEEAREVAGHMLPDVIRYDHREPPHYPDNGRTLTDDVPDYFLPLFTNGKVTGDGVGPHTDLLDEFPYLGPPHGSYEG
jgi:Domain of unknown function (DUF4331)